MYALPNDASTKPLNAAEIRGHVAIVHRSTTPFVKKVLACQEAGATAVVVVDDPGGTQTSRCVLVCDVKRSNNRRGYPDRACRFPAQVDDGRCDGLDCGRVGSALLGGFAPKDDPQAWRQVTIPSILVSAKTGERIRRVMPLEHFDVPKLGLQWVSPRPRRGGKRAAPRREL